MRNPESTPQGATITITIGRFGQTPMELQVPVDSTVEHALGLANVTASNGNIFVGGQPARLDNILDDGDVVNVTTSKQGGNY